MGLLYMWSYMALIELPRKQRFWLLAQVKSCIMSALFNPVIYNHNWNKGQKVFMNLRPAILSEILHAGTLMWFFWEKRSHRRGLGEEITGGLQLFKVLDHSFPPRPLKYPRNPPSHIMFLGIQLLSPASLYPSLSQLGASSVPQNTENDLSNDFLISSKGGS